MNQYKDNLRAADAEANKLVSAWLSNHQGADTALAELASDVANVCGVARGDVRTRNLIELGIRSGIVNVLATAP